MKATAFSKWIGTFLSEKGIDLEETLEVEGPSGMNWIPVGSLVEMMRSAPKHEQDGIKAMFVRIDLQTET